MYHSGILEEGIDPGDRGNQYTVSMQLKDLVPNLKTKKCTFNRNLKSIGHYLVSIT